jgi:hypothetical protein
MDVQRADGLGPTVGLAALRRVTAADLRRVAAAALGGAATALGRAAALLATALLGIALTVLGFAPAASASIGVGIQANPVSLSGVAHPGRSYALPPLYVVNTGTQTETISVQIEPATAGGSGLSVPQSWIRVTGPAGPLAPRQAVQIPLELVTPSNAKPGSYAGDILAAGGDAVAASGARFSAAAATGLEFRITPGPAPAIPAWRWWLGGMLLAAGVAAIVIRRFGLRIRIERHGFIHSGTRTDLGGTMHCT